MVHDSWKMQVSNNSLTVWHQMPKVCHHNFVSFSKGTIGARWCSSCMPIHKQCLCIHWGNNSSSLSNNFRVFLERCHYNSWRLEIYHYNSSNRKRAIIILRYFEICHCVRPTNTWARLQVRVAYGGPYSSVGRLHVNGVVNIAVSTPLSRVLPVSFLGQEP